jgi:hypothetical protein
MQIETFPVHTFNHMIEIHHEMLFNKHKDLMSKVLYEMLINVPIIRSLIVIWNKPHIYYIFVTIKSMEKNYKFKIYDICLAWEKCINTFIDDFESRPLMETFTLVKNSNFILFDLRVNDKIEIDVICDYDYYGDVAGWELCESTYRNSMRINKYYIKRSSAILNVCVVDN